MSYYYRNKFIVTKHAVVRARERIKKLSELSDLLIEIEINNWLNQIKNPEFTDAHYDYYHIFDLNDVCLYIVVNKFNNLVITIRKISCEKKLKIFNKY